MHSVVQFYKRYVFALEKLKAVLLVCLAFIALSFALLRKVKVDFVAN